MSNLWPSTGSKAVTVLVEKDCMSCLDVHKCWIMPLLFYFNLLFQEVCIGHVWVGVQEVRVPRCSTTACINSYLECFVSGHVGAKHVLLKLLPSSCPSVRWASRQRLLWTLRLFYDICVWARAHTLADICFTFATPCVISSLIKAQALIRPSVTLGAFLVRFAGQVGLIGVWMCCESDPEKLLTGSSSKGTDGELRTERKLWKIGKNFSWFPLAAGHRLALVPSASTSDNQRSYTDEQGESNKGA